MSHKTYATASIIQNYAVLKGVPHGTEASLGIALGPIIERLLNGLINVCLGDKSAESVAETMVNPDGNDRRRMRKAAMREARKAIKRNSNPTGGRISRIQREEMREELTEDLMQSMHSSAQAAGYNGNLQLVRDYRR